MLVLVNEPSAPRYQHPKNLRNDVVRDYPSAQQVAVERLLQALKILEDEGYTSRDYADFDHEWFELTPKGRAVSNPRALDFPESRLASHKPLIFIRCGQFADNEKAMGGRLVRLIEEKTPYNPFFAENQRTFEGSSKNIIEALHRMVGVIFVMHKRGSVRLGSHVFDRGSVWIEQEIAIAASLQQLGRKIAVAGYVEDGIRREGLRDLLHLNPMSFVADDEVVVDCESRLRSGDFAPSVSNMDLSEPSPLLTSRPV